MSPDCTICVREPGDRIWHVVTEDNLIVTLCGQAVGSNAIGYTPGEGGLHCVMCGILASGDGIIVDDPHQVKDALDTPSPDWWALTKPLLGLLLMQIILLALLVAIALQWMRMEAH